MPVAHRDRVTLENVQTLALALEAMPTPERMMLRQCIATLGEVDSDHADIRTARAIITRIAAKYS